MEAISRNFFEILLNTKLIFLTPIFRPPGAEIHAQNMISLGWRKVYCAPIKTAFRFQGSELLKNNTFFDEDLHAFIVDQDQVKQSIKTFADLYSLRTRKSREFWLIDISLWTANFPKGQLMNQIKLHFKDLPMDLDDDLYLITGIIMNIL